MPQAISDLVIRRGEASDAALLATHRASMFRDMGKLTATAEPGLIEACTQYFREAIPRGEYIAWLMHVRDDPSNVIAGAGVLLRPMLPRVELGSDELVTGTEAIVMNMYVAPEWRRRGLARRIMHEILDWARATRIARLVLHASSDGRPLYESLGFVPTTEMRFTGSLDPAPDSPG